MLPEKNTNKKNAGALSSSSDNMPYFSNHPNLFPFPPHHPNADRFQQFQRGKKNTSQCKTIIIIQHPCSFLPVIGPPKTIPKQPR